MYKTLPPKTSQTDVQHYSHLRIAPIITRVSLLENHLHCASIAIDLLYSAALYKQTVTFHKLCGDRLVNMMEPHQDTCWTHLVDGSVVGEDGCDAGSLG